MQDAVIFEVRQFITGINSAATFNHFFSSIRKRQ
jgi:hypothetical protein